MSWRNHLSIFLVVVVLIVVILRVIGIESESISGPLTVVLVVASMVLGIFLFYFAVKKLK